MAYHVGICVYALRGVEYDNVKENFSVKNSFDGHKPAFAFMSNGTDIGDRIPLGRIYSASIFVYDLSNSITSFIQTSIYEYISISLGS